MRFQAAHKLVTYLLVGAALAALASTGRLDPTSAIVFLIACGLSFGVDAGTRSALALDRVATGLRAAAAILFLALVWRMWRRLPDPDLGPVFDLVLAPLAYKLFHRRAHRDYIHVLALSLLVVLVAAALAKTFLFLVAFGLYVTLGTWALVLFHLRREMEENYLVKHSAQAPSQKVGVGRILGSRRVVGPAFFAATGVVAAAICFGALGIFMLVPRLGTGFVLGGPGLGAPALAVGDEVTIGRHGTTATARRDVVLRAKIPAVAAIADEATRALAADGLYFRGGVYDRYDRGRWLHSRDAALRTALERDGGRYWLVNGAAWPDRDAVLGTLLRQEIETAGVPGGLLFAVDPVVAVEVPDRALAAAGRPRAEPRWSGEIGLRLGGERERADALIGPAHARYVAFSAATLGRDTAPAEPNAAGAPGSTGAPAERLAPEARAAYLALPGELGARLAAALARAHTVDPAAAPETRARQVVDWLRANHRYTDRPAGPPNGADPVETFVFDRPAGHCELFASAAALLLRSEGIPARYVTGFRGGEWNDLGGYVAVRANRAHAWVEAFFPDRGWTRIDATPSGPGPARPGRLALSFDALDYAWTRFVVGYDLGRQLELAERAGRGLGIRRAPLEDVRVGAAAVGLVAGALAAILLVARYWRRRRRTKVGETFARWARTSDPRSPSSGIERLYHRTARRLARAGWPRRPNETPREYAGRLRAAAGFESPAFDRLVESYGAARFGGHPVPEELLADLAANLANSALPARQPGRAAPAAHG